MSFVVKSRALYVKVQSGSVPVPGLLPMPSPGVRPFEPKLIIEKIVWL